MSHLLKSPFPAFTAYNPEDKIQGKLCIIWIHHKMYTN